MARRAAVAAATTAECATAAAESAPDNATTAAPYDALAAPGEGQNGTGDGGHNDAPAGWLPPNWRAVQALLRAESGWHTPEEVSARLAGGQRRCPTDFFGKPLRRAPGLSVEEARRALQYFCGPEAGLAEAWHDPAREAYRLLGPSRE